MTKSEFINKIKSKLSNFPENIVDDRLSFYTEMIDDYIDEGMTEVEACEKLGSIDEIAESIAGDISLVKIAKKNFKPKRKLSVLEITLFIVGFPIWFSLLTAGFAVFISLYASLICVVISLWAVVLSCGVSSMAGIILFIIYLCTSNYALGFVVLGTSFVLLGICGLLIFVSKYLTIFTIKLPKLFLRSIKKLFIIKEVKNEENC